ncbi:MAG: GTPase Era [Deltaproteobacteria bacterium]|nr:GTPase Era [Deltaproteobacteria bacterium]
MTFKSGYIAILGQPNVGKSTLINCLIGEAVAIVSPKPQTTRNRIIGILNRPDAQMIFIDTPGYHSIPRLLHQFMLNEIEKTIEESDLFCFLVDPQTDKPELDDELMDRLKNAKTMVIVNKADTLTLEKKTAFAEELRDRWGLKEVFFISAICGDGIEELITAFTARLKEGPAFFGEDIYTELPVRFLAAEAIREQAMLLLHQEVPYGMAVEIESFEEKAQITVIKAALIVERTSHKSMVIGKGGQMIKKIGTRAREKIEFMMGEHKVFLELFVKVDADWTRSPDKLRQYGYA